MTDIPAPPPLPSPDIATARRFEGMVLGQLFQAMFQTMDDAAFGGGAGEAMFRGVLAEQMGDAVATQGGVGLAPAVLTQILKLQGDAE